MIGPESINVPSRSNRTTGKRMSAIVAGPARSRDRRSRRTRSRERPHGGAVIPASERGRTRASPGSTPAVSSIVPTSVRTMWRRNESAVTVKCSSSSATLPGRSADLAGNTSCCVSVGVNAVKSCSPGGLPHRPRAPAVDRPRPPERAPRPERPRAARDDDVAVRARLAEKLAWKPCGASSAATPRDRPAARC